MLKTILEKLFKLKAKSTEILSNQVINKTQNTSTIMPTKRYKICLDLGHGSSGKNADPGAMNKQFKESVIALSIGKLVEEKLKTDYDVVMTRTDETYIGIKARPDLAYDKHCDLFVSIHCNASANKSANGMEVLYKSDEGKKLAASILAEMVKNFPDNTNRGLKLRTDLGVLNYAKMPACLVETEFLSNDQKLLLLLSVDGQQKYANAISNGIINYLKGVKS